MSAPLLNGYSRFLSDFLHYIIIDPVCREVNKNVNLIFETSIEPFPKLG